MDRLTGPISDYLPEGYVPLGFVGAIKALDENGEPCFWMTRDGVASWEAIGILLPFTDALRRILEPDAN